jgi:predicted RNA-binding Zn ribbon-like protein
MISAEYTFSRIGGRLCLDFTNSVGSHYAAHPEDHLQSYEDLVAWGRQLEVISPRAAKHLLLESARHPGGAAACLARAKELRAAIYRAFSLKARGGSPAAADLVRLNRELGEALSKRKLVLDGDQVSWTFDAASTDLDPMLWPVACSAAELLTGDDALPRLRECASETCGWLFVDTSKNRSRRWCDMADCGNRAKARRHYRRQKDL